MIEHKKQIVIIGSGVIGLSSAYRLLEAGFGVTVLAQTLPPNTTSDVAAAFWSPSATAGEERERKWAMASLHTFRGMADEAAAGVAVVDLHQLTQTPHPMPYLANAGEVRPVAEERFPAPWTGYTVAVPRIDVPVYMPWLVRQVEHMGGQIRPYIIQRLSEIGPEFPVIVNCTGLGARLLTGDALFPVRGQVISVQKPKDLVSDIIYADADQEKTTYIIPRSRDCLLGGTYQYRNGDTTVDPHTAEEILDRCALFNPALRDVTILQHKVGLRPGRSSVRLETEQLRTGQQVIHNYGHGSIGHTLSWGCAADIVTLVQALVG